MSQTFNEILNLNVSHSTPAPIPTPPTSGGTGVLTPNTGGGIGDVVNQIGAVGCGLIIATLCVLGAAIIIFCLRRQFVVHRNAALLSSLGLFAFAFGLAGSSVAYTTGAIKAANDEHVTNFNVTVDTEPVATVDTKFTLTEPADYGYTVYAFMEGDNALYNADGSAKIIATTAASADPTALTPNSYGVKDFTTDTYGSLSTDPAHPTALYQTDEATPAGSTVTLTYAANLNSEVTDDTYTGHIVYTVVPTIRPTFSGITTMQEMTAEICNNETTPNADAAKMTKSHTTDPNFIPVATLTDVRDGKSYDIAKLADGNCWMRENLKLGGTEAITLNSETSNVGGDFVLPASAKWGATVPADSAHMYIEDGEYYYNWYTATASSRSSGDGRGDATASVCSKGWKLPSDTGLVTDTDYYKMMKPYIPNDARWFNNGWVTSTTAYTNPPLSLSFAGLFNNGTGQITGKDSYGSWWSRTASDGTSAYGLNAYSGVGVYPQTIYMKVYGAPVRCIAER